MVNRRPEEFNEEQRAFLRPFGVYNLTEIPLVHEGRFIGMMGTVSKPRARPATAWSFRPRPRAGSRNGEPARRPGGGRPGRGIGRGLCRVA
jgi:hypothetical protein